MIRFGWVDLEADVMLVLVLSRVLVLMRADDCGSGGWNDGGGCVALAQARKKGRGRGFD